MTFGAEIWGPALIQAAGSIGGGYLSGRGGQQKETKIQKKQRHLIDKLLASLEGQGPYSDLFRTDENAFFKSFVEPAQKMFKNQIAPGIQQQYIASGQQRSTGLEDQLLRAGVDLDSLINQHYMEYVQGAQNRKQNIIGNILGQSAGPEQRSGGQDVLSATGGFLESDAFKDIVKQTAPKPANPDEVKGRPGYEKPVNPNP